MIPQHILQLANQLEYLPHREDNDRYCILVTDGEWLDIMKDFYAMKRMYEDEPMSSIKEITILGIKIRKL